MYDPEQVQAGVYRDASWAVKAATHILIHDGECGTFEAK